MLRLRGGYAIIRPHWADSAAGQAPRGSAMQATNESSTGRYDRVAIWLHWLLGLALLGQLAFGWLLGGFERGSPARATAINLHKSTGLIIAAFIVLRLGWRLRHRPPAYPASVTALQQRAVLAGHGLLYLCMVAMPLTGYLASNFSRHGIRFLDTVQLPPWGPDDRALYGIFNGAHDLFGFVFSAAVAGHIAMAVYHRFVAKDGLAARMLPGPVR
jgi:cytochrome b561